MMWHSPALSFWETHRGVGGDREDQVVHQHTLGVPVVLVLDVADLRVFLVAAQHEGAGADRLLVDHAGLALGDQLVSELLGQHGGERHRQLDQQIGIGLLELEHHGQRIGLGDGLGVALQAHV
jgi:hypothetical protein